MKMYVTKIIKDVRWKRMLAFAQKIAQQNRTLTIIVLLDMFVSTILYGTGYSDYYYFGFYYLSRNQRKTYLTRVKNNRLVACYNQFDYRHIFECKNEFNQVFSKYLKRDTFFLTRYNKKSFLKFIKDKTEIIVKPTNQSGGTGVRLISLNPKTDPDKLYAYLFEHRLAIVEDVVKNHEALQAINPSCLNTLRIITLKHQNQVAIITVFLRLGNGKIVDNTCDGGMLCLVDVKTGVVISRAVDLNDGCFSHHPATKEPLIGFQIPFFQEALVMVKEASYVVPEVNYVAWDIAITPTGPLLIEGNSYPGYYYQFPEFCKNNIGAMAKIEEIIGK